MPLQNGEAKWRVQIQRGGEDRAGGAGRRRGGVTGVKPTGIKPTDVGVAGVKVN